MTDTADAPKKTTLTVTVDGRAFEAKPGELLIAAAEREGTYIPRFCWHPRMREVGMCRMCLVEIDGPRGPALQPACMIPVAEGMVVHTASTTVKKAQDGVLEFLLVNHPLDCPVCDKGGECPLQDQTLTFGPAETRFVEEKRHFEKPIAISDLVYLDRERCILCDRCTRFSKEVAGDPLIHFMSRGNATEINTFPDDPFASYFSGNVVQICPVGALTAKPYRFAARPWDLDQVESTCTSCAVGCRVVIQSSGDLVTRYQGVDSDPVNWGWLCDKGRFDFESIASPDRLTRPQLRPAKGAPLQESSWNAALARTAAILRDREPHSIGVIGGARLTNEDLYAWAKLVKGVLAVDNVDAQLGDGLPAEAWLGLPQATIDDACNASAVLLVGPDVKEQQPVLFLRLRDAAVNRGVALIELSPKGTGMSRYAGHSLVHRPGEVAATTRALLYAANGTKLAEHNIGGVDADPLNAAGDALRAATASGKGNGKLVVVFGRSNLAESSASLLEAINAIGTAYPAATFLPAMRRANLRGALDLGFAPGLLPGRVTLDGGRDWFSSHWPSVPFERGKDTIAMLEAVVAGEITTLVLLGADPLSDVPDPALARAALERAEHVIAVDLFENASSAHADVLLPAAGYAEKTGTTTNLEGRVTLLGAKVSAPGQARPDWMIAVELAVHLGADLGFESVADITAEIARVAPAYLAITDALLAEPRHQDGIVAPLPRPAPPAVEVQGEAEVEAQANAETAGPAGTDPAGTEPADVHASAAVVPELVWFRASPEAAALPQPDAYSLRLIASHVLYDRGTLVQASPSLAGLAAPSTLHLNPGEVERHALRDGGPVRVTTQTSGATIDMTVAADPQIPRGAAFVACNTGHPEPLSLIDRADVVTKIRLETMEGNS